LRTNTTNRGDALERLDAILSKLQPTEDTQQALRRPGPWEKITKQKKLPFKMEAKVNEMSMRFVFFGCNVLLSLISGWLYQV